MSSHVIEHPVGLTWIERGGLGRAAHALRADGGVWLIDPFEDAEALSQAAALGTPRGVVQLLDRHNRDCAALAERLGVAHHRLPDAVPDAPFTFNPVLGWRMWHEVALWWEAERTLVVAEALGTAPHYTAGRALGVHPMLRLVPPRRPLTLHRPDRLLVGHGEPVLDGAAVAIDAALHRSRSDIPRLLVSLPRLALKR